MKKSLIVITLFLFCLNMNACLMFESTNQIGNNDWSYELPNNYVIWHVNSQKIVCGKKKSENSIANVGGDYVVRFCYNDEYICIQCVEVFSDLSEHIVDSNPQFYIVNTLNDEIEGPISEKQYKERKNKLYLDNLTEWIETKPRPEGAKIP